ncbi:DUF255 domain-containing protein [Acetobacteraceae bacterium]|nr:DUF255 domain-containing protein [Acetobacteraceae bacterium]
MRRLFLSVLRLLCLERKRETGKVSSADFALFQLGLLASALFTFFSASLPAKALESVPQVTPQSHATLMTLEENALKGSDGKKQILHAGLFLSFAPQWHTYWRNPGDAGETPELTLELHSVAQQGKKELLGVSNEITAWETPVRFSEAGLTTFGYENQVFLPLEIPFTLPKNFSGSLKVTLQARWLVCEKLCIPEKAHFDLDLPLGTETVIGPQKKFFDRSQSLAPKKAPFETILDKDNRLHLRGQAQGKKQAAGNTKQAYFYPYEAGILKASALPAMSENGSDLIVALVPEKTDSGEVNLAKLVEEKTLQGVIEMVRNNGQNIYYEVTPVSASAVAKTTSSSDSAVEKGTLSQDEAFPSVAKESLSGFRLLILAFIGGFFLNLMPCVFPVLAMKVFSLARLNAKEHHETVMSAVFYALGTVSTFLVLGMVVLALQHAGHLVGWGFQFQSPVFVTLMCWLLLLLGLNLAGLFEIMPPASAGKYHRVSGHLGDFVTGVLAVVVASPCTAPFMGVALAGALMLSGGWAFGIFVMLGGGLAFPYLLIACWPAMGRFLPKPGAWMEIFKQALSFPLFAACIWLIWVIARQGGGNFAAVVLAGGLVLAFGGWLFGLTQKRAMLGKQNSVFSFFCYLSVIFSLIASLLLLWIFAPSVRQQLMAEDAPQQNLHIDEEAHQRMVFTPEALEKLRKEGKPVFVDIGASWCITCIVNEHTTLNTQAGEGVLKEAGAVFMRGDWTKKTREITQFLQFYRHSGVPLYVWFPKDWPLEKEGIVLPQVLTPSVLKKTLQKD